MRRVFKKIGWLSATTVLVLALLLQWPFLIEEASATEVNIDTSIFATGTESNSGTGRRHVFVSDQVGYAFYDDSTGDCVYSKTTDGGANWGGAVTFDDQATNDCLMPTVWYDRWTPGDTGSNIHIITKDPSDDGLWYNRLDTSNDTLLSSTSVDVSKGAVTHSMGTNANNHTYPAITKATDGELYIGIEDDNTNGDGDYVIRCSSSCDTPSNWNATEDWTAGTNQGNPMILLPLAGGDIMAIHQVPGGNDVLYQTYDESADDWSHNAATWATIDINAEEYQSNFFGATVDPVTNDIFLAYVDTETNIDNGGCDDDIKVWRYNGSWTQLGSAVDNYDPDGQGCAPVTGNDEGLVAARIGFNTNNTDIYVVYSTETTAGTATTRNIYYKTCNYTTSTGNCDDSGDWSSESSALNSSGADNYDSFGVDLSSKERMYVSWVDQTDDDIRGETAADIGVTYSMSAYRWFANANSTDVGSALATQDNAYTLTSTGEEFRLRLLLHVAGDGARTNLDNFKLQFATKSGSCDTGYSGESYSDITTGTAISYNDNATPADGDNLTDNANDPDHSTDTTRNQDYEEANNFTNSVAAIAAGEDGEWDFALYDNGASASTSYCFRVVYSDASAIAIPTVVPEITTAAGGDVCTTSTTDQQMRHGNIFDSETEQRFCWAD